MKTIAPLLLLILATLSTVQCGQGGHQVYYVTPFHWIYGITVYQYKSYHSVQVFRVEVPQDSIDLILQFRVVPVGPCGDYPIIIYLQPGGIPLAYPTNDTFPPDFYTKRTEFKELIITNNNKTTLYHTQRPVPGDWFGVVFMNYSDDRIKQRDLQQQCRNFLTVSYSSTVMLSVQEVVLNSTVSVNMSYHDESYFKLFIGKMTSSKVQLQLGCHNHSCNVSVAVRLHGLPGSSPANNMTDFRLDCVNQTQCTLNLNLIARDAWYYLRLVNQRNATERVQMTLYGDDCLSITNSSYFTPTSSCQPPISELERSDSFQSSLTSLFEYIGDDSPHSDLVLVTNGTRRVASFEIRKLIDIGSTLSVTISNVGTLYDSSAETDSETIACLMKDLPLNPVDGACPSDRRLVINATRSEATVYVPYPEYGTWYITLGCPNCSQQLIELDISLRPCVDAQCGRYGTCGVYQSGDIAFGICRCVAGYRGYGCTDATLARPDWIELLGTCLLTISNGAFLPAIIVALIRRHFILAFMFLFNMFFSTMYHACDEDLYKYCMFDYSTLQISDFYASYVSFWATLTALTQVRTKWRDLLYVVGTMIILVAVIIDLHSMWGFLATTLFAAVLMAISWVVVSVRRKRCFPERRQWLLTILPGVLLAAVGLVLYTAVETDENYAYVHSVWHVLMASAIVVVMPPREVVEKDFSEQGTELPSVSSDDRPLVLD